MATVEQCEPQSTALGTLSSTLDLFDSYKPAQEEDKDSDEESFHLPMLDCDEDLESNNKESAKSETDKDIHDETEDDILNKFETTGTPDLDPKIEDSILEDIDELCENKPMEEDKKTNNSDKDTSQEKQCDAKDKIETSEKVKEQSIISDVKEMKEDSIDLDLQDIVMNVRSKIEKKLNGEKQVSKVKEAVVEKMIMDDVDMIVQNESKSTEDLKKSSPEHVEAEVEKSVVDEIIENDSPDKLPMDSNKDSTSKVEEIGVNVVTDTAKDEKNVATKGEDEKTVRESPLLSENGDADKGEPEKSAADLLESMEVDSEQPEHSEINKAQEKEESTSNEADNKDLPINTIPNDKNNFESLKPENQDIEKKLSEHIETTNKEASDKETSSNEEKIEDSTHCKISDDNRNKECLAEKLLEQTTLDESNKQKDAVEPDESKSEKIGPDKCENSNDSSKNLECDDLLDISIIRDVDEDNASAIAENANDEANDARCSEKSDNDDQDEGSEKAENELDESEMDQEDSLLVTDKDDNMDFEDGTSNLGDQGNTTSENTSDSENKDFDVRDSENDSKESSSALKEQKTNETELSSEKPQTDTPKDISSETAVAENKDSVKENSVKTNSKRSLSETDLVTDKDTEVVNKRFKLSGEPNTEEKKSAHKNNKVKTDVKTDGITDLPEVKTLLSFEKYMQSKKLKSQLSRSDLEQFCLQKICEAIMHKTDVGELHQTIKKQEVVIETLRKDLQQLSKQTRDLDIVNKKLMNELKTQNGNKKPLVPLKITRSVGLQVKLNIATESSTRRKMPVVTTPRTPSTPNATNPRPRTIAPANTNVVRQVVASPRKPPTSTPLLSKALQNRQASPANTTKRVPIRPKPAEPQKPANQNVIVDLTDEDDKAAKGMGTPVQVLNKTISMAQGKTINIVQAKPVPNKTINNQNKTVAVGQVKTSTVGAKVGTPTRTVTALPQGVRLTPTQVKNGSITIPASVVTSSSGTTQLMYVVQPTSSLGQVVTSTAGGTQKAVLLNFQPTNGVLTSALNGSAVSVIPTKTTNAVQLKTMAVPRKHPAPLPLPPPGIINAALKPLLPKPHLSIRKTDTGIILQWRMPYNLDVYESIASYQLFAYQETNAAPSTDMWRKVGDVKALALPMACTLTQFADKNKYYFAVRSVDVHKRIGAFSDPEEISL